MSQSHEYLPVAADADVAEQQYVPAQAEQQYPARLPRFIAVGLAGAIALGGCSSEKAEPTTPDTQPAPVASASRFQGPVVTPEAQSSDALAEPEKGDRRSAIVQTALKYVWGVDDSGRRKTGFKNDYKQKARDFTGMSDAELNEPNNVMPETDCGLYVSMVMRESGADPEYPLRETNIQQSYLRKNSNPEDPNRKYDRVRVDSVDDLLAGDIAMYSRTIEKFYDQDGKHVPAKDKKRGHTYLIIKSAGSDGAYDNDNGRVNGSDDNPAASASWKDHSPQAVDITLKYQDQGAQPFDFYRPR
jgi:hypothetical protein